MPPLCWLEGIRFRSGPADILHCCAEHNPLGDERVLQGSMGIMLQHAGLTDFAVQVRSRFAPLSCLLLLLRRACRAICVLSGLH